MHSKAETLLNKSGIDDVFELTYCTVISNIQKSLRQVSGWINHSVIYQSTIIFQSSILIIFQELPKELDL